MHQAVVNVSPLLTGSASTYLVEHLHALKQQALVRELIAGQVRR